MAGVHVMAYRQEEFVDEIIQASGVLKGRQPSDAPRPSETASVLARAKKSRFRKDYPL